MAFADPNFKEFTPIVRPGFFLCMTPYVQDYVPLPILFNKEKLKGTLCEYLSVLGKKQFKIAETEKYAHVTFFFNGGDKTPFPGEEQVLISSPKEVATYDLKPEMSAYLVCDRLEQALSDHSYGLYVVNFANSDMIGHTGNYEAAIKAIEALDIVVKRLMDKCTQEKVTMLVTADHGNSDQMAYENGDIHTSHTEALVPFIVFDPRLKNEKLESGGTTLALKDVAPTILHIMGVPQAPEFQGTSVFK
jgi:2,3-bisphosphoglycerate-independent phosphoglycerate mutase